MSNAFERVPFRGFSFDRITMAGVLHLEEILGHSTSITQGPYSGYAASGNTHTGSGGVDWYPVPGVSDAEMIRAGRLAGWAIWVRPELWRNGKRVWRKHYHGIQIGNDRVSDAARKQVQDYYAGLDGLVSHFIDPSWRPNVIVGFNYPLRGVNLKNVAAEAVKTKTGKGDLRVLPGVRRIQRALNLKSGSRLTVDGKFGKKTQSAYARWERQNGGDGDGIPAAHALRLLGAARFRVVVPTKTKKGK